MGILCEATKINLCSLNEDMDCNASQNISERETTASARLTLTTLRERFPDTPFLALGQTALWDEPTKASLRLLLDEQWPDAAMIAGVHDTDYFAKLPGHGVHGAKYALMSHDDGRTRGLWSAAGEMSRLFGSEDVATRTLLEEKAGVSLTNALSYAEDPVTLHSELTTAWGWTGIIYTDWDKKIAADVALSEILPTLLEQIDWATQGSVECLSGERTRAAARIGETLKNWVGAFAQSHPAATLPDLYRDLLPRLYELASGVAPRHFSTTTTQELLRFNRATCHLPRFAFVELFLNPITRRAALDAYNLSVGTEIYTLDRFGEGALPFDLVIPGLGRGTLRVPGDGTIFVDTPRRKVYLCSEDCDISSIEALANLVEQELGPEVTLVGKAISLLPMLSAEYTLVFHEGASGYTHRTRAMVGRMQKKKLVLPPLRPILRIKYATWDALAAVPTNDADANDTLLLPPFLQQAKNRDRIAFDDFAACWRNSVKWESGRLDELRGLRSPRALMSYLARTLGETWKLRAAEYEDAADALTAIQEQAQQLRAAAEVAKSTAQNAKREMERLAKEKGEDFRAHILPYRVTLSETELAVLETERSQRFDAPFAIALTTARNAQADARRLKSERHDLERGPDATAARLSLRHIEAEAERQRAALARNALQTVNGLPHTNFRPSAWWFPMVDPSGAWFRRLTDTAELYLEPLSEDV